MSNRGMNRRQFLQTSGLAAAGAAVAASATVVVAPDGAWAMSLDALDEHAAKTLVRVTRRMYPHDALGDMYYARVVEALDEKAAADPEMAQLLKDGVAELDGLYGVEWLELSDGNQLEALRQIEGTPFFDAVRSTTVVELYNNPLIWRHFGYEGPSYEYGGYLERGFDDLGWLDEA